MVSVLANLKLTRAFAELVLLADVRGIVFDGRFGKSLLFSVSCNFVVSAVQAMSKVDLAMHLLTTAAAVVNTFAQGSNAPSVWSALMISVCLVG